jgi:hypothetical protein
MGMYTELLLKTEVKEDIPLDVEAVLQFLFNGRERPEELPDHPFFQCQRWSLIGQCSSFYHVPWSTSRYFEGCIFSRSDLKNYGNEIDLFLDWIAPYLQELDGTCIGWSWYEEADVPTLLIKGKK